MDEQREFGRVMGGVGFRWGTIAGALGVILMEVLSALLIWQAPGLLYEHRLTLWPSSVWVAPIAWIRLGLLVAVTAAILRCWPFLSKTLIDGELTKHQKRLARTMADAIMVEPNAHRRQQLIALFRVKYPEERLHDATWY